MPASPHKCKLCGHGHWNSEPHVFADDPAPVTKPVTKVVTPVTKLPVPAVTKPSAVTKPTEPFVTPPGAAVRSAGRPRVYATNAERQRAYRARRQAGA